MGKTTITTRIRLSLLCVFAIMFVVALYLFIQFRSAGKDTETLYEHPFLVSNTVREIKIDLHKISQLLGEVTLADNDRYTDSLKREIMISSRNVDSCFKIISLKYLGNPKDKDSAIIDYGVWVNSWSRFYELKKENKTDSINYLLRTSVNSKFNEIFYHLNKIRDFAQNKANTILERVTKHENFAIYFSIFLLIVSVIVVLFLIWYLSGLIGKPIKRFVKEANQLLRREVESNEKIHHDEKLLMLTLDELKFAYQNIERQSKEIEHNNKKLADVNNELDEKVKLRTKELNTTNEYLEKLFKYANAPIIVWDHQFRITRFNPAFEELTGRKADEVIGKTLDILFPADQVEKSMELIRKTHEGERWEIVEICILHKDGSLKIVQWNSAPVLADDGVTIISTIAQGNDITVRKQTEHELKVSEKRYRSTLDQMLEGCQIIGFDWKYIYLNDVAEAHSRRPKEELLGKRYMDLWPGSEKTELFCIMRKCMEEKTTHHLLNEFDYPDGSKGWFDLSIQPVPEGVFILSNDITERKRMEAELLASKVKLETALESMTDAIFISDVDGKFVEFNEAFATFHKFRNKEECAKTLSEYPVFLDVMNMAGELMPLEKWAVPRALSGEVSKSSEYILRRKDTGESWVGSYSFAPVRNDQGDIVGSVVTARDITDRKRAEEELRESENTLSIILNKSPVAIILTTPYEGTFIDANETFLRDMEYSIEELKGHTSVELGIFDNPEDRKNLIEVLRKQEFVFGYECHLRTKSGKILTGLLSVVFIKLKGKTCQLSTIIDITERKKTEQYLKESEELYRILFENMLNGFAYCRMKYLEGKADDFTYISVNKSFETLTGLKDVVGKKVSEVIPGFKETDGGLLEIYGRVAETGKPEIIKIYVEGLKMWFSISIYSPEKEYFVAVFDVITERKKTLASLEKSNKELEQFAYVASHDLQEPLRMVSSYTQLLSKRYRDQLDEDAQEFIGYAVNGAMRMQKLINDLLEFSRLNTRKKAITEVDMHELLGKVRMNLSMMIEERNVIITNDELPQVKVDETQFIQLFQNLISNGIKYNQSETPHIHISAKEEKSEWIFSIKDNGIGIDKQFHERIFGIFQRLHSRNEYSGTGIGLAICKRIIDRHEGRIWLESELEKGTVFYFSIPK